MFHCIWETPLSFCVECIFELCFSFPHHYTCSCKIDRKFNVIIRKYLTVYEIACKAYKINKQSAWSFRLDIRKTYLPCVLKGPRNKRQGCQPGRLLVFSDGAFVEFVCVYALCFQIVSLCILKW